MLHTKEPCPQPHPVPIGTCDSAAAPCCRVAGGELGGRKVASFASKHQSARTLSARAHKSLLWVGDCPERQNLTHRANGAVRLGSQRQALGFVLVATG